MEVWKKKQPQSTQYSISTPQILFIAKRRIGLIQAMVYLENFGTNSVHAIWFI